MAEIDIQRKKKTASPWLLILLVLLLLVAAGWYLLHRDNATTAPPAGPAATGAVTDPAPEDVVLPEENAAPPANATDAMAAEGVPAAPADFYAFVADDPAAPGYARRGLMLLSDVLVSLADRADLRDPAVEQRRNDLTSATARLSDQGSMRPGFVASAELMRAMQQRGYPSVEREAEQLTQQARDLTGRTESAAEQLATQKFFQAAANVLRVLEKPATY